MVRRPLFGIVMIFVGIVGANGSVIMPALFVDAGRQVAELGQMCIRDRYNGHRIARTDKASMPTVYSESLFVEDVYKRQVLHRLPIVLAQSAGKIFR